MTAIINGKIIELYKTTTIDVDGAPSRTVGIPTSYGKPVISSVPRQSNFISFIVDIYT